MNKKIDNKKLTRPLLVAMLVVTLILGGTYAWIRIGISGSKTNVIKAGGLDLVIDETPTDGDEVRLEKAIPQSYRQGLTNKPYKFTLKNNSTIDTDYTISLEDYYVGADASLTDNDKIADSLIRYILVKNDDELVVTNSKLLSTGRTIDLGTIAGKTGSEATAIPYTLYIWIDSKAGDQATEAEIMSKIFNARLRLTAEQHHAATGPVFNLGDLVYMDPVSNSPCNSDTFSLDGVKNHTSTCYKWRVTTIGDTADKTNITLQMDHNINNQEISWASSKYAIDSSNDQLYVPNDLLGYLSYVTSTWTKVPLLNFSYDTSNNQPVSPGYGVSDYGVFNCVNGSCSFDRNGNSVTMFTNMRARIITADEIIDMVNTIAPSGMYSHTWKQTRDDGFYYSNNYYSVGSGDYHNNDTSSPSMVLWWLGENLNGDSGSGCTKNVYSPNYNSSILTESFAYWTLTPVGQSGNSAFSVYTFGKVIHHFSVNTSSGVGIRPVVNVPKTIVTK